MFSSCREGGRGGIDAVECYCFSYRVFQTAQLECVRKYPQLITEELERYDKQVCSYFTVERNKPSRKVLYDVSTFICILSLYTHYQTII